MGRNRKKVVVAVLSIVLLVSVVGGWALSRSSDICPCHRLVVWCGRHHYSNGKAHGGEFLVLYM